MNETPKVSVMVTLYNSAAYLNACLESLRRQTFQDFEVVMPDGGSTDETPALAQAAARTDSRFRYFPSDRYKSVSESRAEALPLCRGKYVAILDSDDMALPKRLEKQTRFMDKYPDTALLATYYRVINAYNWPLRLSPVQFTHDVEMRWRLTFGNCLTHSTVMFRKDIALAVGGYDATVRAGEDAELYTRLMERGRVEILPYVLTAWRFHKKSLQQTEPTAYKIDFIKTVCRSLKAQLGEDVSLPVAAALFNQGIRPAESAAVFLDALRLVQRAIPFFNNTLTKPALERRFLARTAFLQLFDLGSKNCGQGWWPTVDAEWKKALEALTRLPLNYRWFRDAGLLWYYKKILKSDPRVFRPLMETL